MRDGNALQLETYPSGRVLRLNRRQRTLLLIVLATLLLGTVFFLGIVSNEDKIATNLALRNMAPSWKHPFGTDWLGRDMFIRTMKGLTLSIQIGLLAASASAFISLLLGLAAATLGKWVDEIIAWLIDLFLSLPHLVTLLLISFTLGGGLKGVVIGVALTHWPTLTRVIRAEVLQLRSADYVQISRKLGKSRWWIATQHILPHIIPQVFVGLILLFPHAILHEASITFLGFGLSPHQPAIGIILSESMRYLSVGMWWLAFFPGLSLLIIIRAFDVLGENLKLLIDPYNAQE